nr:hypothetical protein [Tanacetum cinerariifolium]
MNFPLAKAFTKTPLVLYQNFLEEFWYTAITYDPNPPADDSEERPLMEYKIKFTVMNGKMPLTLDFRIFVEATGLDHNQGTYVSHSFPEVVKAELSKIATDETLIYMTSKAKEEEVPDCVLATKTPPTEKGKTTDPKDLGGNDQPTDKGLPSMVPDEGTGKTTPLYQGPREDKDLERLKPLAKMESKTPHVTPLSGADAEDQVDQTQSTRFKVLIPNQNKGKTSFEVKSDTQTLLLTTIADVQALLLSDDELDEESDNDVFEAGDEMDKDIQQADEEETKSPKTSKESSTKVLTKDPVSQEH